MTPSNATVLVIVGHFYPSSIDIIFLLVNIFFSIVKKCASDFVAILSFENYIPKIFIDNINLSALVMKKFSLNAFFYQFRLL